jgi:hypothetical protein
MAANVRSLSKLQNLYLGLRPIPRAAMEQGGWLDIRSVIGYAQDVPAHRRQLVADMDDLADAPPRRNRRPGARR